MSRRGNFFGSTIVDLAPGDPPPQSLSLAAGLALIEAAETTAPDLPLPNWPPYEGNFPLIANPQPTR